MIGGAQMGKQNYMLFATTQDVDEYAKENDLTITKYQIAQSGVYAWW